jgi:pilus assembly protein CpaC
VSQLVSMSANGLPITTSNNMSTYINLKSGDTAAIGGIVQNTGYKGFKEGSDEKNVIIDLTRSKSFQRNKTQFVMFVTPEIVVSAAEASKKAKEAFNVK